MKEKTLLKTALICTIAGIFFLYIISENVELEEKSIFEAKQINDEKVRISGYVEQITRKNDLTIITISKNESIDVVFFENIDFDKGAVLDIVGEIKDYNGEKEIIAEKIEYS